MRIAIIDSSGLVINVIEATALEPSFVPPGGQAFESNVAGPGDTWNGSTFVQAPSAGPPPILLTLDEIYDASQANTRVLKAVVLALNDGSFVPGQNKTGAQLKAIIKAKM